MRRIITGVFLGLALASGTYSQSRLAPPNDPGAVAKQGESEIVINAMDADRNIAVWVNDVITAHVFPKTMEKIIVQNGRNIVQMAETNIRGDQWTIGNKKQVIVDSATNRVTIGPVLRYGRLINLHIEDTVAIAVQGGGTTAQPARPARRPSTINDNSIEGAVNRAVDVLLMGIPEGATLAILSISSRNTDMANFVMEELAYLMVETRKFRVVDRKSLDVIRAEANFQYSGEVDDNSAVSIGKLLGATIVITGSISGSDSTRRLRVKALDVKTAEIKAMASERF
ncbi:MAG: CsgG/HfaB family protein [Treponema sp.]|nr:CsgG/HfaB family protein [Treponema sp.]